ncbi:PAS domain S-box/diguanylate cyclase (GGDEF) domain [Thiomonas bhubaneswarensis]|uniref:PAS domain S-box/diguanylate cyclase (GGDEF) domain n=2 Tax=Thiomonas bhubaneswarensis TaxID=339866 RepID=A0A0K6HQ04_9BURK|nr:PAS domain S-box/diguanylate cyclase (GGDEF) domain [Thiomonas bhubaneswarensis]
MASDNPSMKAQSWCHDIARWAEHLPLMAACFDAQSSLLYCNTAYAHWLGRSPDALHGQSLEQLVPAAEMPSIAPHVEAVLRGQISQYERQSALTGLQGGAWLQVRLVPFPPDEHGAVDGYFCFMQDTTRLHASDSSLDLLRTSPGLTIWDLDLLSGQLHAEQNWLDEAHRYQPKTFTIPEWMGHVVPADLPALEQAIARISAPGGFAQTVETRFIRVDGQMVTTMNHGMVRERNADGVATRIFGLTWDITELRQTQKRLHRSESRFRMLAELSNEWFWESDAEGVLSYISRSSRRSEASPLARLNLIGANLAALYPGQEFSPEWAQLRFLMEEREEIRDLIVPFRLETDAALLWWRIDAAPIIDSLGLFQGYRGVVRDVTQAHQAEEKLELAAYRDALTGLANRTLFEKHVEDAIAVTPPGQSFAVLFIGLDRFKLINDALGHAVGDQTLIETAKRLVQLARPNNTAARFGGDEFLILARDAHDAAQAMQLAKWVQDTLSEPIEQGGRTLQFSVSIGVAVFPQHGTTTAELLGRADAALHESKTLGRNRVESFSLALQLRSERRSQLEEELRAAIAHHRFEVHFQPIWSRKQSVLLHDESASVEVLRGAYQITSFEALARWTRGNGERVQPDEFISILTDSGMLDSFGPVMMEIALEGFARLRKEQGFEGTMAYNVSPRQLHVNACVPCLSGAAEGLGIPADRLVLELTENVEIEHNPDLLAVLDAFRGLGVQLALDDFGAGYSNLGYLTRLPVNQIKLDRAIAAGVSTDRFKAAIARATLTMAKTLSLEVVAEGVETLADLLWLERAGCPLIQGWVFSRALNVQQALNLLRELREPKSL